MSESSTGNIQQLRQWIKECEPGGMVFFGGAGVSTESGIPDFRSADGIYNQKAAYPYPPEVMISRTFFDAHPDQFYDFYCDRMLALDAKPNQAHRKLAQLEKDGICGAVITQNIDGLHQAAGSGNVLELHGSVHRNFCMQCGRPYTLDELLVARKQNADGIPRCECGGTIKPDVVLYEEPLDQKTLREAIDAISKASLMVIAGTSLAVYPAAGLLEYFNGEHLAIVNRDATPADKSADLCIRESVGKVFGF